MKRFRVALVLEATEGGTRRHLDLLVSYLSRTMFDLTVVCSTLRDPSIRADLEKYRAAGVEVRIVPMTRSIRPVGDLCNLWRLFRLIRREQFDIVHTHSSKAGILGRIAAKCAGGAIVLHTPHVFAFQQVQSPILRTLYILLERLVAKVTDAIVCVSESEREEALLQRIISPKRLFVVPNSISWVPQRTDCRGAAVRARLDIPDGVAIVGTVANYRKQKGLEDFIDAAAIICERHPEIVFLMIGSGVLGPALKRRIAARGIQSNFRMCASDSSIWDYYACMDVFVLASKWEGMPYALLEAMAIARAVVVTAVGGCKDILEQGKNGFLVPVSRPGMLAEAVCLLLEKAALRQRIGEAAAKTIIRHYYIEDRIHELEAIYQCAQQKPNVQNSTRQAHA